jgi:hypothetical protein
MVVTKRVGWLRVDICGNHSSLVAMCHLAAPKISTTQFETDFSLWVTDLLNSLEC